MPVKAPSKTMRGIQSETVGIQTSNENSNGIIERYKRLINKEEIQPNIIEDTPFYKDKDIIAKVKELEIETFGPLKNPKSKSLGNPHVSPESPPSSLERYFPEKDKVEVKTNETDIIKPTETVKSFEVNQDKNIFEKIRKRWDNSAVFSNIEDKQDSKTGFGPLVNTISKEKEEEANIASTSKIVENKTKSPLDTYWDGLKNWNKTEEGANIASTSQIVEDQTTPPDSVARTFEQMDASFKDTENIDTTVQQIDKTIDTDSRYTPERVNLFESINALRKGKGKIVVPDKNTQTPNVEINIEEPAIPTRPKLPADLMSQIHSKKLEYGSPNIANLGLNTPIDNQLKKSPSISSLIKDAMNLWEDNPIEEDLGIDTSGESSNKTEPIITKDTLAVIDSFDKIPVNIDSKNHKFNIDFGDMKSKIKSIHAATNDGYLSTFDLTEDNNFPWDKRSSLYKSATRIIEIHVTDHEGNTHSIYKNPSKTSF